MNKEQGMWNEEGREGMQKVKSKNGECSIINAQQSMFKGWRMKKGKTRAPSSVIPSSSE